MTNNIDFPIDELTNKVKDSLLSIQDIDLEGNSYIHTDVFKDYIEDLQVTDIDLLDDIRLELGDDVYNRLLIGDINTLTLLDDRYSQACM